MAAKIISLIFLISFSTLAAEVNQHKVQQKNKVASWFFLCFYWFFHFETWHERFIYISLSIAVVYLISKIIPDDY